MKNIITILIIFFAFSAQAQKAQDTIVVDGICGMCKDRIEKCLDVKGIWHADWNVETKKLFVVYKPSTISKEEIGKLLNDVGHDNEFSKATDKQYSQVHNCCLYRDDEVINAHQHGTQKNLHDEEH